MSADAATKSTVLEFLRERLALVRWFRLNASAKHGIPLEDQKLTFEVQEPQTPVPAVPQVIKHEVQLGDLKVVTPPPPTPVTPTAQEPAKSNLLPIVLHFLGGAIAAGVIGSVAYFLFWEDVPAPPPTVTIPYESPLQWLEDRGQHLPSAGKAQSNVRPGTSGQVNQAP